MAPPPRILVPVCFPMCPCHIPCVPCPLSLLPLHPVSGLYVVPLPPFICPLSPVIPFPPQSTAPCCFFSFVSVVSPVPLDNMPPPCDPCISLVPLCPLSTCVLVPLCPLSLLTACPLLCHCPPSARSASFPHPFPSAPSDSIISMYLSFYLDLYIYLILVRGVNEDSVEGVHFSYVAREEHRIFFPPPRKKS